MKIPFPDDDNAIPTIASERAMRARLASIRVSIIKGADLLSPPALVQRSIIVGRGTAADVRLSDPKVSTFHLELTTTGEGIEVRDLQSRNGTYCQGVRLDRGAVPSGSLLTVGESVLRVELDSSEVAVNPERSSFGELCGVSDSMRTLFGVLERLARTELAVLLEGSTGVGKELAARAIHAESQHRASSFTVLDCTAIPASLAESVLFGHEKGAFTGATERRPGVFEAAGDGTIFLDEVGELPLELQAKLLRVLERREVVRIGSVQPNPIAARVISATWRDLRERVNTGHFREDLYYRLTQARVVIPPLRDRPDDIPALVDHFLARLPSDVQCARSIDDDAKRELCLRDFPGNVRELKNTVERASMTAAGDCINTTDLAFERLLAGETRSPGVPSTVTGDDPVVPFKHAKRTLIEDFERQYLASLLVRADNNLSRASVLARIERHYLRNLLRKHGLRPEE